MYIVFLIKNIPRETIRQPLRKLWHDLWNIAGVANSLVTIVNVSYYFHIWIILYGFLISSIYSIFYQYNNVVNILLNTMYLSDWKHKFAIKKSNGNCNSYAMSDSTSIFNYLTNSA